MQRSLSMSPARRCVCVYRSYTRVGANRHVPYQSQHKRPSLPHRRLLKQKMSAEAMVAAASVDAGSPSADELANSVEARTRLATELGRYLSSPTGGGLGTLMPAELELLNECVAQYPQMCGVEKWQLCGSYGCLRAMGAIGAARARLGWTTFGHTGGDVPLYAYGPHSGSFAGVMDNTQVGARVADIMSFNLQALTDARTAEPALSELDRSGAYSEYASWTTPLPAQP